MHIQRPMRPYKWRSPREGYYTVTPKGDQPATKPHGFYGYPAIKFGYLGRKKRVTENQPVVVPALPRPSTVGTSDGSGGNWQPMLWVFHLAPFL